MAGYIAIPKLSIAMARATIVEWKAKEGERVEKDSVVLIIETEKTSWEVKAELSGLLHIMVTEGVEVEPNRVVGVIAETKEELEQIQSGPEKDIFVDGSDAREGDGKVTAVAEQVAGAPRPERTGRRAERPGRGWFVLFSYPLQFNRHRVMPVHAFHFNPVRVSPGVLPTKLKHRNRREDIMIEETTQTARIVPAEFEFVTGLVPPTARAFYRFDRSDHPVAKLLRH